MKVLLLKDVYKLGRAGDVKRVAAGYGRNYLIPQGLAVLATTGALKQAEHIRQQAASSRAALNQELSGVAEQLANVVLFFPARASETGKLYGSVTSQMVAVKLQEEAGIEIERRQLDMQPIRSLGEHTILARLTMDLIPEFTVIVHREGEIPELPGEEEAETLPDTEAEVAEQEEPESEPESEA